MLVFVHTTDLFMLSDGLVALHSLIRLPRAVE
jgi:hypothetical protein